MSVYAELQYFFDELGLISFSEYKEYMKFIPQDLLPTIGFSYNLRTHYGHIFVLNHYRDSEQLAIAA